MYLFGSFSADIVKKQDNRGFYSVDVVFIACCTASNQCIMLHVMYIHVHVGCRQNYVNV